MQDIKDSIRAYVNERLSSPLLAAYIFSWVFINYRVPLWLVSDIKVHVKIALIDDYLHGGVDRILHAYGWPALIATIYVFLIPIPVTIAAAWTLLHQNVMAKLQQVILSRRVVTLETLESERSAWAQRIKNLESQLSEVDGRNERLRESSKRHDEEMVSYNALKIEFNDLKVRADGLVVSLDERDKSLTAAKKLFADLEVSNQESNARIEAMASNMSSVELVVNQFIGFLDPPEESVSRALKGFIKNTACPAWLSDCILNFSSNRASPPNAFTTLLGGAGPSNVSIKSGLLSLEPMQGVSNFPLVVTPDLSLARAISRNSSGVDDGEQ